MAFHRRKLPYASPDDSDINCQQYCDPENTDGKCPVPCMHSCILTCKIPIDDFPPPPPPPTADSADDIHYTSKHHALKLSLTIPLVIVSTIVFFLACFTIYKFCIKRYNLRRRQLHQPGEQVAGPDPDAFLDEDHGPNQGPAVEHHVWFIRTVGLDPSVISAITIVKYKKGDGLIEGTDCSVCLDEFREDETLRLLPKCSHAFHIPCIDTWLRSHTNCPMCRARIVNNTAILPSHELIVHNSRPVEENPAEISRSSRESTREFEIQGFESGIRNEDDANSQAQIGLNRMQPVMRSVSMDALSASMVTAAITNASDDQLVEVKEFNDGIISKRDGINQRLLRLVGNLSIERPACIKRSLSCSANV